jgi:hypothetical protein
MARTIVFDEMISTLYAVLEFNSTISLKTICPRVDMSVHSDTLSLVRANQSLLLLLSFTANNASYIVSTFTMTLVLI